MKYILILPLILTTLFIFSCETEETAPPQPETNPVDSTLIDSTLFEGLCIPPFTVDTDEVKMRMKMDGVPYMPTANWACEVQHPTLGMQLWINGSTPPIAFKAVSIITPVDIGPGTYTLQFNAAYDARYVPSGSINYTADFGILTITVHDQANKHIEGGFEFTASDLSTPVQPSIVFTEGCFQANY